MGLVTEYYLDAALSEIEDKGHKADAFFDQIGIKDGLESALFLDYEIGDTARYIGDKEQYNEEEVVVTDTRPFENFFTSLSPQSQINYDVEIGGRTITVSEDDLVYERSNT
ncbi:hypothetical protein GKQ38_00375 [Candidatus Nanohaloarchaea archaeon]|nr:hypothetical protein GKQ38_00375 [Candidatus Nanohaloarchaea archaeon]